MRTYMWWQMREAIRAGLALEFDAEMEAELTSPEYGHNNRDQLALEKKDDIKKRLGMSPDNADALALTFAMPVMRMQDRSDATNWDPYKSEPEVQTDWNPYQ
jgi:hypothetical protein